MVDKKTEGRIWRLSKCIKGNYKHVDGASSPVRVGESGVTVKVEFANGEFHMSYSYVSADPSLPVRQGTVLSHGNLPHLVKSFLRVPIEGVLEDELDIKVSEAIASLAANAHAVSPNEENKPGLPVRVTTTDLATATVESVKEIDLDNTNDRSWLGKHASWALRSGKSVLSAPIGGRRNDGMPHGRHHEIRPRRFD